MKAFGRIDFGHFLVLAVLSMQILLFLHLKWPESLSELLNGPLKDWLQSIGSIVAILASYKLGERAFRKQVHKEKVAELQSNVHAYQVLEQILNTVAAVDELAGQVVANPLAKQIRASAQDTLQMINSVPALEVPHPDLVRRLTLSRQAMISYIGWADTWLIKEDMSRLQPWASFANDSQEITKESITFCVIEAAKLQGRIRSINQQL